MVTLRWSGVLEHHLEGVAAGDGSGHELHGLSFYSFDTDRVRRAEWLAADAGRADRVTLEPRHAAQDTTEGHPAIPHKRLGRIAARTGEGLSHAGGKVAHSRQAPARGL